MRAYDAALMVKAGYDYDIEYFRGLLTWEAEDMGFFTEMIADASLVVKDKFQGEGLRWCAEHIAYNCERNIKSMDDLIRDMERDSVRLHSSVYLQVAEMNIKAEGLPTFDCQHDQRIAEALAKQDEHFYRLREKWMEIFMAYFNLYYQLDECIDSVLHRGE